MWKSICCTKYFNIVIFLIFFVRKKNYGLSHTDSKDGLALRQHVRGGAHPAQQEAQESVATSCLRRPDHRRGQERRRGVTAPASLAPDGRPPRPRSRPPEFCPSRGMPLTNPNPRFYVCDALRGTSHLVLLIHP